MLQPSLRAGLVLALALAALAAAAGPSRAITYTFSGDCDTPCGGVSGSISFDDAALVPGNPYPAPTSFSFDFGTIEISDASALSFGLFAFPEPPFPAPPTPAVVPADVSFFGANIHTGETPQPSGEGGDALAIMLDGRWVADADAICTDTLCTSFRLRGFPLQGTGAWAQVPEPRAAGLLAAAWTVLGLAATPLSARRGASASRRKES